MVCQLLGPLSYPADDVLDALGADTIRLKVELVIASRDHLHTEATARHVS